MRKPPVVVPLRDLVEHRRRLLAAPAERHRRGRPRSARRRAEHDRGASSRRASSRAGSRFGTFHFRASRSCASVPHGAPCSTRCEFVRTSWWWSATIDLSTSFFVQAGERRAAPGRSAAPPADRLDDRMLGPSGSPRRSAATSSRHEAWRDAAARRARCLPTQVSPRAGSSSFAHQKKFISSVQHERPRVTNRAVLQARHLLPERRQHDVCLREEQREADLVDPLRCLRHRAHHVVTSLHGVPTVTPFRALRYEPTVAGPLESLVAPPYDVISEQQRLEFLARSPYNVVHLTLPDSPEERPRRPRRLAGQRRARPRRREAYWWVAQDYIGPDGVARTREGFAASVAGDAVRGGAGAAARAHARRPEGRPPAAAARDADAARADLPALRRRPVFARPAGDPAMDVSEGGVRTRMWPVAARRR